MSQAGVYAESKMVWWYAREHKLPDAPKQVQLILSDLCNQDCSFCAYRMSGYSSNELFMGSSEVAKYGHSNPVRWIETARALRLIDEFKELGVLAVQFTGGGEPSVHPHHEEVFRRTLEHGLRASLVSNGLKWSEKLIFDILPKFDWVRVSIDSGNKESYARIRRTPETNWARVWENVSYLATAIRDQKSNCALGVGFVVTPESYEHIVRFAKIAKDAGAHNVRYTAMFSTEDEKPFEGIYDIVRTLINETRSLEDDSFRVYDNFGSRVDDLAQKAPDYSFCSYQHYTTYVGGDLNAYRCCVLAYNKRGLMPGGNLATRSFVDFWNSPERKADMAALDARGCERCQFNVKNRAMLYVMGNTESDVTPRHMEWP